MKYQFSCVDCPDVNALIETIDNADDIEWDEFLDSVDMTDQELNEMMGYDYSDLPELKLQTDYAVSFHKSKYNGRDCVFFKHSAIEYVFYL